MQRGKLDHHGCDKIFEEKKSGASRDQGEALAQALTFIREGDQFVVTRLDRLVRSVLDLSRSRRRSPPRRSTSSSSTKLSIHPATGRLPFHMLAGEFERDLSPIDR